MGKLFGLMLLAAVALAYVNRDKISNLKERMIEVVNPAAKERRIIGELDQNLNQLESLVSVAEKGKSLGPEQRQKLASGISSARQTLRELAETNQKTDLAANLSNILQKIVPFSEKPSPTWLPPNIQPKECLPK